MDRVTSAATEREITLFCRCFAQMSNSCYFLKVSAIVPEIPNKLVGNTIRRARHWVNEAEKKRKFLPSKNS